MRPFRVERRLDQLTVIAQAMFDLLRETSGLTDEQLKTMIIEIDGRDVLPLCGILFVFSLMAIAVAVATELP